LSSLRGIFPALATPIDASGLVQAAPLQALISHLYGTGVHGLYVAGQTGEGWQLDSVQRKRLAEIAVRNSPTGAQVVVHVGTMRVADAIDLACHAGKIGAAAVSSLPPPGAGNGQELLDWYGRLAEASPLPLYVYYFPGLSPAVKSCADLLSLCALPNVAGLKYAADNLEWMSELLRAGTNVLFGRDEVLASALLLGAHGGIGTFYNLVPEWLLELYSEGQAGRWSAAARVGERLRRLIHVCLRYEILSACKVILRWQGFDCGPVLSPHINMTASEENSLRADLIREGFAELIEPR
jgi:N-acetylneuraminate lyase